MKRILYLLALGVLSSCFVACTEVAGISSVNDAVQSVVNEVPKVSKEKDKNGNRSNDIVVLVPEQLGEEVYSNADASIDSSCAAEGYVSVAYTGSASKVRMLIETPSGNTYNYLMSLDGQYSIYPLSEGSGKYNIGVYENIKDDQYSMAFSQSITVELKDDYSAFLYPNAYVNFDSTSQAVVKAKELAKGASDDLDVVEEVYHFIANNISYDYDKAATVQSGYVPIVDDTLATGKGICFDYASLMGAMLRSQGIPTRLEVGYAGTEYHAWISVYIHDVGWIDDIIQFDGSNWSLMDPTLASYAKKATIKEHLETEDYYQLIYKY